MPTEITDATIASFLNSMTGGQYLLLALAVRKLGGELKVDPREFAAMAASPLPLMHVDASDGPIMLKLQED